MLSLWAFASNDRSVIHRSACSEKSIRKTMTNSSDLSNSCTFTFEQSFTQNIGRFDCV